MNLVCLFGHEWTSDSIEGRLINVKQLRDLRLTGSSSHSALYCKRCGIRHPKYGGRDNAVVNKLV